MPPAPMGQKPYPFDATSMGTGRWYEESSDCTWTLTHEAPLEPSPPDHHESYGAHDEPPHDGAQALSGPTVGPPEHPPAGLGDFSALEQKRANFCDCFTQE